MYQGVTLMIVICSGFIIQASPVTYFTTDDPTDRVLVPSQTTGRLLKCTGKNDCNLVGDVLKPEAAEEVKKTADAGKEIAFVLDGSASIQPDDFQRAKDFIYNVMSNVWETCFDCDFAVVQYGFDIKTELSLRDSDDRARALKKVQEIQQLGRVTKTASAIHHVLTNVFVPENGSKNNSRKMIIVLSDEQILGDPMNLTDVLNMPQMEGITRFAIRVGDNLKPEAVEEIKEMADTNKFFHVSNYTALHNILGQLEQSITRNAGTEISFVLDGSGSIQPDDFHRAKYFIYNVMLNVWKMCFDCDFAVVQYGFDIKTELSLRDSDDRARALKKVQEIQQLGRVTKTASAIHHVLTNVLVPENGSKNNSRKMIIVLSDGHILGDPMNLTDVLNMPQMEEITRFAIGVGDNLTPEAIEEMKEIADTNKYFNVSNYAALDNILAQLAQNILEVKGENLYYVID